MSIEIDDVIVFSVELLQSIADDEPNPVPLSVREIRERPDGTKVLVLARLDTPLMHIYTGPNQ